LWRRFRSGFGLNAFSDCERLHVLPNSMRLSMAARRIQHRRIIDLKTGLPYSLKKAAGASRHGGYIAIN
jgi:hypothetical protein